MIPASSTVYGRPDHAANFLIVLPENRCAFNLPAGATLAALGLHRRQAGRDGGGSRARVSRPQAHQLQAVTQLQCDTHK